MNYRNSLRFLLAAMTLAMACTTAAQAQPKPLSPKETGAPWPDWELIDFQPKSPRFNETYGLDHFRGRVTLVALLATWCPYCRVQLEKMEELKKEFESSRVKVNIVAVNIPSGHTSQKEFTSRCSFPLFQDNKFEDAFGRHGGGKDDYYIYNERGELFDYFPYQGDRKSDLAKPEGYANIKQAILDAPFKTHLSVDTVAAVKIEGIEGRTYRIDYSEKLGDKKDWKPLKTITLESDRFYYFDLEANRKHKRRFYRVEEVP